MFCEEDERWAGRWRWVSRWGPSVKNIALEKEEEE